MINALTNKNVIEHKVVDNCSNKGNQKNQVDIKHLADTFGGGGIRRSNQEDEDAEFADAVFQSEAEMRVLESKAEFIE